MESSASRWVTVSDSPHDHEREALAFLRRALPDRDPIRVWTNFEFTAPGGNLYEVDALVITSNGVHLIEVKSHPGQMGGDANTWRWTTPEGRVKTLDNPRLLANKKAKALKSALGRTKSFSGRHHADLPYIAEEVFLSDPALRVTLNAPGRHAVFGRDEVAANGSIASATAPSGLGGIVAHLLDIDPTGSTSARRRVDRPLSARLVQAVDEIGIRERSSRRMINDYRLGELLLDVEADRDTGVAYQDFLVEHVSIEGVQRRLRVYPLEVNATPDQREAAARAARREFEHLHALSHPGIAAPIDYIEHERGPCLLFERDPDEVPLDRWIAEADSSPSFDVTDRLSVVRSIAEAVSHAHGAGVYHRALCPSAVLVSGPPGAPVVKVADWHAGARTGTGDVTTAASGTEHVDALSGSDAALYRAPEFHEPRARPALLDVFSLGCLAAFTFTGAPPAPTPSRLRSMLAEDHHVEVAAVDDTIDLSLAVFVALLTDVDPSKRPGSIAEALGLLDDLEEDWTAPEAVDEPHPTAARRGSTLADGRFRIIGRLGSGSTAFALLARDREQGDRECVLKVALEPALNSRIDAEAGALQRFEEPHPSTIVRLLDGPIEIDGLATLVLTYAGFKQDIERAEREPSTDSAEIVRGERTLATRIGDPSSVELVERFGDDLLDAVTHLDEAGVFHRDIKPGNLALTMRGPRDALHLVLFDFSLASAPLDRVDVGTRGYVDPFLRNRGAFDPAADRYSAAVVLYELCTGARPIYGDGTAEPSLVDSSLTLDPAMFDASVADGLVVFFGRALAPDATDRFGTPGDMRRAWTEAFRAAHEPAATDHPSDHGDDVSAGFSVPSGTTGATALAGLPLSNGALAALERIDVLTVGDLLAEPVNRFRSVRGMGARIRNEVMIAHGELRDAVPEAAEVAADAPLSVAARPLVSRTLEANVADVLGRWLGLDRDDPSWPSNEVLVTADTSAEQVDEALAAARERWKRQRVITALRNWIATELDALGGLAAAEQLAERLAASRPAASDEERADGNHRRAARALVRAALVTEAERSSQRWIWRRVGGPVVVTLDALVDESGRRLADGSAPDANQLADYGESLARRTGELLDEMPDSVVGRPTLVAHLRQLEVPANAVPLPDAALAELAASLCPAASVNTRLELYPTGMTAPAALRASRRALVALPRATVDDVQRRVASRFPAAEALPGRPELDGLLANEGLALEWSDGEAAYLAPSATVLGGSSFTSVITDYTGWSTVAATSVEIDVAQDFEESLDRSVGNGGLRILVTDRRELERVGEKLARFPVTVVDVEAWILDEIDRISATGRPSWDVVLKADAAGPGSDSWNNLRKVAGRALDGLTDQLAGTSGTVLLTRLGLLRRFDDRLTRVGRWRDLVHDADRPLKALWMLVATPQQENAPMLDGVAISVITDNEWTRIPSEWISSVHRAGAS